MKLIPDNFFIFDGWFGLDKIGHFSRHVLFTLWYVLVLDMGLWAIVYVDTQFDLFYEYMNYRAGIGFSILDVVYGRTGMLITILILHQLS